MKKTNKSSKKKGHVACGKQECTECRDASNGIDRYQISRKLVAVKDIYPGYMLVYNFRRGTIRRCSSRFWRALNFENRLGGYVAWRPELKDLMKDKYLIPVDEDEQKETIQEKNENIKKNSHRQLYWSIWPSADCNLGCDYCGQSHSKALISQEHCDMVVEAIRRRLQIHGFKKLHISWFGGEPLTGLKVIRYLTPRLIQTAKELEIPYDARMITNGTLLTKEISRELVTQHHVVWFEITVDGPREIHDKRRCTKQGGPTYDLIMKNITDFFEMRKTLKKGRMTLRCNVDIRNIEATKKLIDELSSRGFEKEFGRITFAAVFPWGKPEGQKYRMRKQKAWAKRQPEIAEYAATKGISLGIVPLGAGGSCQVSDLNSSVNVLPGGRLYQCGEVPLVTDYEGQRGSWWDMGTIEDMLAASEKQREFVSTWWEGDIPQGKWPCTKCKYLGVCSGECPRQRRDGLQCCPYYIHNIKDRMRAYSKMKLAAPKKQETNIQTGQPKMKVIKNSGKKAEQVAPIKDKHVSTEKKQASEKVRQRA